MPRRLRAEARAKAAGLIEARSPKADAIADAEARSESLGTRDSQDQFWTAVAIAIAEVKGEEIGAGEAHRWPDALAPARRGSSEGRGPNRVPWP